MFLQEFNRSERADLVIADPGKPQAFSGGSSEETDLVEAVEEDSTGMAGERTRQKGGVACVVTVFFAFFAQRLYVTCHVFLD